MPVTNERGRDGKVLFVLGYRELWGLAFIPYFSLIYCSQVGSCASYLHFPSLYTGTSSVTQTKASDRDASARALTSSTHTRP